MRRHEFSRTTKREALKRSGGYCEASGSLYGLEPGERCNSPLSHGVDFDHYPMSALDEGSDGLDNCVACCRTCHRFKTSKYDVPMQAKGKRIRDKASGIRSKATIQSAPFPKTKHKYSAARGRVVER